jgi:hypothetical protein
LTIEFVFDKLTMLECNWKRALLVQGDSIRFQDDMKLLMRVGANFASKKRGMTMEDVLEIVALRRGQVGLLCHDLWDVGLEIRGWQDGGRESFQAAESCWRDLKNRLNLRRVLEPIERMNRNFTIKPN